MSYDTIIRGGTVATASDTFSCDVGITGGRIAALGANLGAAKEVVDATGKLVLPGGIDSHVHLSQPSGPGIVMADDFASGTRAAAFGGNTMVLPFAMQQKGESLREVVFIDPERRVTDVLRKGDDGLWVLHPSGPTETVHLASVDVALPPAMLWAELGA